MSLVAGRFIGAGKVFAYDAGGMDKEAASHLSEYLSEGFLEMTPMREILQFNVHHHGKASRPAVQHTLSSLHSRSRSITLEKPPPFALC